MRKNRHLSPSIRLIEEAFQTASLGFSVDRVICDPELNLRFIIACGELGLKEAPCDLNLRLLNRRKKGSFQRTEQRPRAIRNQTEFSFASEIAVRCLERKYQTTLDRVLCDPQLALEFDGIASAIAPGFSAIEYRWAALRLRKASKLKPEILGRVVASQVVGPIPLVGIVDTGIPADQGLYILSNRDGVLYVGEAQNLRARLKKHFDHSDNKLLARHMWEFGKEGLWLEYHVLPEGTQTRVRKALELELIRSRRAEFNVKR